MQKNVPIKRWRVFFKKFPQKQKNRAIQRWGAKKQPKSKSKFCLKLQNFSFLKKLSEKVVFSGFQNAYQVKGVFVQRYKVSTF